MPIYEYKCNSCEQVFEVLTRTHSDTKELVCPECNSQSVAKMFSSFNPPKGDNSCNSSDASKPFS